MNEYAVLVDDNDKGKPKQYSKKNLSKRCSVNFKLHMDWPATEHSGLQGDRLVATWATARSINCVMFSPDNNDLPQLSN